MKVFLTLLLCIPMLAFAQVNRFIYEYTFIPNIHEKGSIKKELMALDIDAKGSVYQSMGKLEADSIMQAEISKMSGRRGGNFNFTSRNNLRNSIGYRVTKDYPEYTIFLHERVGRDRYKISENEKINWKIDPEVKQIGKYKTQKATAEFGGRSWIAWFSQELPFQDGPYKFYGLPGLIVHVEDNTGSHIMTLAGNKTLPQAQISDANTEIPILMEKEIPVSEAQFTKVYRDYVKDPAKNMRQMMNNSGSNVSTVIRMRTADGREISDMNEMAKMMEKSVKENEKKNNNRIELNLY